MAFSRNKRFDVIHEGEVKQIVVNTDPSFKTVVGLLLLGGTLGAAGVCYLKKMKDSPARSQEEAGSSLSEKGTRLAQRASAIFSRAQDTVASVRENISPVLQNALEEARATARQTEQELLQELDEK